MFKCSCLLACTQPYSPFVIRFVDDALQGARPCVSEALLEVVASADGRHASNPNPVIDRF